MPSTIHAETHHIAGEAARSTADFDMLALTNVRSFCDPPGRGMDHQITK